MGRPIRDLAGQQFGRLTVLSIAERTGRDVIWSCQCSCGTLRQIRSSNLTKGYTTSCGCFHRERVSESNRKHGQTINRSGAEYGCWRSMKRRCLDLSANSYARYGGVGVTVCAAWRDSFEAFLRDVGPRPTPWHSLDRYPDNAGHYEPGNVRWATRIEQGNNRRDNRYVVINGQRLTMAEATRQYSLDYQHLYKKSRRGQSRRRVPEFTLNGLQVRLA